MTAHQNTQKFSTYLQQGFLLVCSFVLLSCANTPGLSVYSFSNSDIETVLKQQLPKLGGQVRLLGQPVQLEVNNLNIDIGPDNREVVILDIDTSAGLKAFTLSYNVGLMLKVEGSPFYDSGEKAIFLRNVKLLDSSINAGGYKGNLGVLNNQAMDLVNAFLAVNPIYTLDMQNSREAILSKLPLDLKVANGAIALVPKL